MNTTKKITSNVAYQLLNQVVTLALGIITSSMLARYLGVEGFGNYNLILTFVPMFALLGTFQADSIGVREMAQERDRMSFILGNLILLKAALIPLSFGACWLAAWAFHYPPHVVRGIQLFSLTLLMIPWGSVGAVFQVHLRTEFAVLANLVQLIAKFLLFWAVIYWDGGFTAIILALVIADAAGKGISLLFARRFVPLRFHPDRPLLFHLLKESWPLLGIATLGMVSDKFGFFFLSKTHGGEALGLYSAGARIFTMLAVFPQALMVPIYPLLSEYYVSNPAKARELYQKSLDVLLLIALPTATLLSLFSRSIILFLFGPDYQEATAVQQILAWQSVIFFLGVVNGSTMVALGKQRHSLAVLVLTTVMSVLLNVWWVSRYSYLGFVMANFVARLLGFAIQFIWVNHFLQFTFSPAALGRCLAVCLVVAVIAWPFRQVHVLIALPILGMFCLVGLWVSGAIDKQIVAQLFQRSPGTVTKVA